MKCKMFAIGCCAGLVGVVSGCAAPRIDASMMVRPARAAELDAYDVFVGRWAWEAEVANANENIRKWTGSAEWEWTLDKRVLHGRLASQSGEKEFEAAGAWTWHPKQKRYMWAMFNNWGYPQQGTAKYDARARQWTMDFQSVGLDGTKSRGRYRMTVVDENTLDWTLEEWADGLRMIPKMSMRGTYRRQR